MVRDTSSGASGLTQFSHLKTALEEKITEFILDPKAGSWALDCFHLALPVRRWIRKCFASCLYLAFIYPTCIKPDFSGKPFAGSLLALQTHCRKWKASHSCKHLAGGWKFNCSVSVDKGQPRCSAAAVCSCARGFSGIQGLLCAQCWTLEQQQGSAIQPGLHPSSLSMKCFGSL